jgi:hypothetical protein
MTSLPRLDNLPVLLSASLPPSLHETPRALDLQSFIVAFVHGLLSAGGRLIFGGHPSLTPLVERVAQEHGQKSVELYQLEKFRGQEPPEAHAPSFDLHWIDGDALGPMREQMTSRAQAAVFLGGKTADQTPSGGKPGIRDEYERFLRRHRVGPAYVLSLLDGEAALLAEETNGSQPNHLSSAERQTLSETTDIDLAAALVLADLRRHVATPGQHARSRTKGLHP